MAIAYSTSFFYSSNTGGSQTLSGNLNTIIAIGSGPANNLAITVDGISMTGVSTFQFEGDYFTMFIINGIASGSHTFALSNFNTGGKTLFSVYSGCATTNPDTILALRTIGSTNNPDVNFSPIAANCWEVGVFAPAGATSVLTYINCVSRQNQSVNIVDSNGTVGTGLDMSISYSTSQPFMIGGVTLAPRLPFSSSSSDSVLNGQSRDAVVTRAQGLHKTISDSIINGASRTAIITKTIFTTISDGIMNAKSRFSSLIDLIILPRLTFLFQPIVEIFKTKNSTEISTIKSTAEIDNQKPTAQIIKQ